MIENLKIGYTVSKDQVVRYITEDITVDNVLDAIDFDSWFIEYDKNGQTVREEFENACDAQARYNDLKTWVKFGVIICDYSTLREEIENG